MVEVYKVNSAFFLIGNSTMYAIISEVCTAICRALNPRYGCLPQGEDWFVISDEFKNYWNLPKAIGALDSRHFKLNCPPHSGSTCYNYKGLNSMILIGISDAHRRFIWTNIGDYGNKNYIFKKEK